MLEDFKFLVCAVVVHKHDSLESVVDRQVGGSWLSRGASRVRVGEVLGLAQLEVVLPSGSVELAALWRLRWMVKDHFNCLGQILTEIQGAECVTSVQEELLVTDLDGSGKFVVTIEEVSWQPAQVLLRPRMDLLVKKIEHSNMVRIVTNK